MTVTGHKDTGTAYLLCAAGLLGIAGLHRFYVGKAGTGIVWLLTLGLFFIGTLVDFLLIPQMVKQANALHNAANLHHAMARNNNVNQITINMPGSSAQTSQAAPDGEVAWDALPARPQLLLRKTSCPNCKNTFSYQAEAAGRTKVTCPTCGASGMLTAPAA